MSHEIFSKLDYQSLLKNPKKGSRRQLQIAEATIAILHNEGLENLTFEALAQQCQVVRGVIYKYFPTLTDLLLFTSGLIRYRYQSLVIEHVSKETTPQEMLKAYIRSALSWPLNFPRDTAAWFLFFHRCCVSPELQEYSREWVDMGTKRIAGLLMSGIQSQDFQMSPEATALTARKIQLLITGGVISCATEKRSAEAWKQEHEMILDLCLSLVN